MNALVYGNGIPEPIIEAVHKQLTDNELLFIDAVIKEISRTHRQMLTATYERAGVVLPLENYYFRLQREIPISEYETIDLEDLYGIGYPKEFMISKRGKMASVEMARHMSERDQASININFIEVVAATTEMQERIIHLSHAIRMAQELVGDEDFRRAVEAKYGSTMIEALEEYIKLLMTPYKMYKGGAASRFMRFLRHVQTFNVLAFNVKSIANQFASICLVIPYVYDNPIGAVNGIFKVMTTPVRAHDEALNKSKILKHRSFLFEEAEVKQVNKIRKTIPQKISEEAFTVGMFAQRAVDRATTTLAWQMVYESEIHKGSSVSEAVKKADDMIVKTQPMPWVITQNLYMTGEGIGGELARTVQVFTGQLRQNYNILTVDMINALRRSEYLKAFATFLGLLLSNMMILFIGYQGIETGKDFGKWLASAFGKSVPLLGNMFVTAFEQAWYRTALFGIEDFVRSVGDLTRDLFDEEWGDALKDAAKAGSSIVPFPSVLVHRVLKYQETGNLNDLFGTRRPVKKEKKKKKERKW